MLSMNIKGKIALTTALLVSAFTSFSQVDSLHKDSANRVPHIAIFAPLYLDSAFDASGNYRYDKNFPRFMVPGVDFWEGIQLAVDSLKKEGAMLDIHIYDTKSAKRKPEQIVADTTWNSDLIIGHVSVNEAALLARTASKLNIPFINVNLPNDASVTNNPNFVILNSTLQTNITGTYKFLQKNFALSNVIVFRKKGVQEDRLKENITEAEKSTAGVPLKMKYVMLEDNFTTAQLTHYLDSTATNVCLAGSLDLNFAQNLCQQLSTLSNSYTTTVVGMPTWEMIDFEKPQFKGIDIYYSTPFYISPTDKLAMYVQDQYQDTFFVHPSDMVYRGYEALYHFGHLLMTYKKNLNANLGDKKYKLFTEFDIEPAYNKKTSTTDYFENKKLYFVKKVDGIVKAVY
jgi:hypothetical protein